MKSWGRQVLWTTFRLDLAILSDWDAVCLHAAECGTWSNNGYDWSLMRKMISWTRPYTVIIWQSTVTWHTVTGVVTATSIYSPVLSNNGLFSFKTTDRAWTCWVNKIDYDTHHFSYAKFILLVIGSITKYLEDRKYLSLFWALMDFR